ncbi:MAG: helix-turn-helix domain-containing protein [Treponema sp.]|jgi:hypothetical protein|nr:helix-turn-helix domain-containing protein [Treponema sp.]
MSLEKRRVIEAEVQRLQGLTELSVYELAGYAGVPRRTWDDWKERAGQETRHNGHLPREHWLTPAGEAAIVGYCRERMDFGYRLLCRQMVDKNIAAVSPPTVYNVLKRNHVTKKWVKWGKNTRKTLTSPRQSMNNATIWKNVKRN